LTWNGRQPRYFLGYQRSFSQSARIVLGQHALHECGLEGADHSLAVGVGRVEVAVASAF
jgi:hypothetical protein